MRGRGFFSARELKDLGLGVGWDKCMLLRCHSSGLATRLPSARCCSFNTIATLATRRLSSSSLTSARLRLSTSAAATRTRSRSPPASSNQQQLYPDRVYASPAPEATTPSASEFLVKMVKPIQGTQYALDAQFKKISRDFRT